MLFVGATANIKEIGWLPAVQLDDVHGGHGQSSTVDKAADVSIKLDVGESSFFGTDFNFLFFREVPEFVPIFVSEFSVLIKGDFGIQRNDVVVSCSNEGVDFEHGTIAGDKHGVHGCQGLCKGLVGCAGQSQRKAEVPLLITKKASVWVNGDFVNLFWRRFSHVFNVHATFR